MAPITKDRRYSALSKKYSYETPMWAVAALCSLAVVISLLCLFAVYNWERWAGDEPIVIRGVLAIIGLGFLIAGVRPRNWKPWRYFYADDDGIHFPSECPETNDTEWLLVPWERVGSIQRDEFYGRYKGPSIELKLRDDEINRFFRDVKLSKIFFNRDVRENGFFKVGYSNAFKKLDDAIRVLNEIKEVRAWPSS